jgi:hypothetical protein
VWGLAHRCFGGELEQLWDGLEVPEGVGDVHVPEIGRESRHLALHVSPFPVPAQEGLHGQPMPHVVEPRPVAVPVIGSGWPEPYGPGHDGEVVVDAAVLEADAALGEEEGRRTGPRAERVAPLAVLMQRFARRVVEGHEPRLPELAAPDREESLVQIDVVAIQGYRLADPQAGGCEQSEERGVCASPESGGGAEASGFGDEAPDLLVVVDIRWSALVAVGQEALGRDLGAWVGGAVPGGEATDVSQAAGARGRRRAGRLGPPKREVGGDDRRPFSFEELDETVQMEARIAKLGPESATQGQVAVDGLAEGTHRAPPLVGQGRATSRRASKSSLA